MLYDHCAILVGFCYVHGSCCFQSHMVNVFMHSTPFLLWLPVKISGHVLKCFYFLKFGHKNWPWSLNCCSIFIEMEIFFHLSSTTLYMWPDLDSVFRWCSTHFGSDPTQSFFFKTKTCSSTSILNETNGTGKITLLVFLYCVQLAFWEILHSSTM